MKKPSLYWKRFIAWLAPPAVALTLVMVPAGAQAAEMKTDPAGVTIGPGQTIDDDLYIVSQTASVQGTVNGNVLTVGSNATVSGVVNGDVFAAGNTTTITGEVRGNVYAAGGTVVIGGSVGKDVLAFGGTLQLQQGASIGRDVLIGSGNATVAGSIGRNLHVNGSNVTISGPVGGSVNATAERLTILPGAAIKGSLAYTSPQDASIAQGTVAGSVTHTAVAQRVAPTGAALFLAGFIGWLRNLVGLFALGLILVLLMPRFSARASARIGQAPWASLGIGVGLLAGVPVVAIIGIALGAFIGGWWLALVLLGAYAVAMPVGYVLASFFVANAIGIRTPASRIHPVWIMLAGLVVLTLAGHIPFLGPWITFAAIVFGLGAFGATLAGQFGKPPAAAAPEEPLRPMPLAA